jgi:uncharacterized membrane protein (DUF373 family)
MMVVVVILATLELGVVLVEQALEPPRLLLLDLTELLTVFGFFLMILIGLELIETMKLYLTEDRVRLEVVFAVALTAVARKIIILDIKELEPLALLGLAGVILALGWGYVWLRGERPRGGPRGATLDGCAGDPPVENAP